jgi:hypothetical protein
VVFPGVDPELGVERRGELGEHLVEVVEQLARIADGQKRELQHAAMIAQAPEAGRLGGWRGVEGLEARG